MDDLKKIVMVIDADNTQLVKLEAVMREITKHGRIVVKRAYGNWRKDTLKNWEDELKRLAVKAVQQFDYVTGKNATDMALVIDTIDLLHEDIYDAFVIVASDSDYTPLAIKLRESGVYVIGVGEKKTPDAFRKACDEFILLENLTNDIESSIKKEKAPVTEDDKNNKIEEIHELLRIASDSYQDEDGYVYVSTAGNFIKRANPDFDSRTYGYINLSRLLEDFPKRYKVEKRTRKSGSTIVTYKCL